MNKVHYNNELTGEWGDNHKQAVEWYRTGATVGLYRIDRETGELYKVCEWVW